LHALLLLLLVLLAGCQRHDGTTITIGGTATPNTPGARLWLDFKERAEQASGGRIRMRALIYGQLGSEEQLLSGLRRGRIHYANLSAQIVSGVVPELTLLYAPFLFESEAEADYVYDRHLTGVFRELLAAKDLHLVTWYEIGFHDVYARAPLLLPADARGRRFRVASSLNARMFAEAIGADVIPLGFAEIVSSLQTGLIEAGENSVTLYSRTGIAGEAPHLTLTNHLLGMSLIVSRKRWWDALSPGDRQILTESFPPAERSRAVVRAQTAADLADAAKLGFTAHALTPEQREEWRRATAGMTPLLIEDIGGRAAEVYAVIQRGKAEFAAGAPHLSGVATCVAPTGWACRRGRVGGARAPTAHLQSSTAVPVSAPRRRSARASSAASSG
jgi:TRAP-type C4-dicarboxylate transport system substrate-binding protein